MITSEKDQEFEARAIDRLILFSDAVVAIAITLLALELPVPEGRNVSEFWASVRENHGHYLAFLISFLVIAASWGAHHRVFRAVERADPWLRTINMFWLLMIVLNPFATKLLTTVGQGTLATHALRFGFYSFLQVLASLALLAMSRHLTSHDLRARGSLPASATVRTEELYGVIIGFGLSIPLFFATTYGWVLWIAGPVLAGRVHLPSRRRGRSPQDA